MELLVGALVVLIIFGVLLAVLGELIVYILIFLLAVAVLAGLIGGSVVAVNAFGPLVFGIVVATVLGIVAAAVVATQLETRRLRRDEMLARDAHWRNCPNPDRTDQCPTCGIVPRP